MLGHKRIPSREGGIEVVVEELSTRMVDVITSYSIHYTKLYEEHNEGLLGADPAQRHDLGDVEGEGRGHALGPGA